MNNNGQILYVKCRNVCYGNVVAMTGKYCVSNVVMYVIETSQAQLDDQHFFRRIKHIYIYYNKIVRHYWDKKINLLTNYFFNITNNLIILN